MGMVRRKVPGKYDWEGAELVTYDKPTVKGVSKRVLIGPKDGAAGFAMRYFEVQPGGNSAFEHHEEIHEVYVLRGRGKVLLGKTYHDIAEGDVIYIEPNEQHELRAAPDQILGFLCVAPKP
ncbi:MAG TPA: cupin domain-containing protein [Candidatus Sulfotelmatobacter sp.]|nr:cupin domain-containing protein [Candidatus Sulfotelmatobacter sp.]